MRKLALLLLLATSALAAPPQHLPQNWSATDWDWFYTTPQGSKLIPYAWGLSLERVDDETLFFADGLARLGYLPNAKSGDNPDGLPVGFVRDPGLAGDHIGMTCAACHTSQVNYKGNVYQVDGAPTDADLFGFLAEISEAVQANSVSATDPKFLRFAGRVLGAKNGPKARAKLYSQVKAFSKDFSDFIAATTSPTSWGRSRADAFGAIFNRVTAIDLGIPANNRPPNAPVSYPFLWDTGWHNVVQWNGSAPNQHAALRLARNVGEVLGVFAEIKIRKPRLLRWYYESTANRINLLEIEDRLANLRAPKWTDTNLPPIDAGKVARGQAIYTQQCLSCHAIATPGVHQNVVMTPLADVGTDPVMVTDAATREAKTGKLEGVPQFVLIGPKLGPTASAGTITLNAVVGAILSPLPADWFKGSPGTRETQTARAASSARTGEGSEHDLRNDLLSDAHDASSRTRAANQEAASDPVKDDLKDALAAMQAAPPPTGLAYKARPLDGIWATAPYLHNGSVPTLRDLLLPVAQRPKTFRVGSRELDPVNVGFDNSGTFLFDTSKVANSNVGHEWPWSATMSEDDVMALVEYLKGL